MVDLKERFQALDQVPAPDLGRVIELRARHLASVPGALGSDPDAIGGRRFRVPPTQLLAAAAVVMLRVGPAGVIHQGRIPAPGRHAPTSTPLSPRVVAPAAPRVGGGPLPTDGATCAPTIDETHYHTVKVGTEQPARRGRTGIWVVTGYQDDQPYVQTAPPSEADVRRLMDAYLIARIAGTGAEKYVGTLASDTTVHLDLYATSRGSRFRRFEIASFTGPEWPSGTC